MIQLSLDGKQNSISEKSTEKILSSQTQKPMMGWVQLPEDKVSLKASKSWAKSLPTSQNHLCVLGIGGSSLGTQAIYDFLQPKKKISFLSNVDGYEFEKRLSAFQLNKTHFVAVSKSGETSETLIQLGFILQLLKKKKLIASKHITVITEDRESTLRKLGKNLGVRYLPVPLDVGGRFSVFTNVGMAPLVWAGINMEQVLSGAREASNLRSEISRLSEFYLQTFYTELWMSVFWIYCEGLKTFGLWLEQLWSESLAKKVTLSGKPAPRVSTPLICAGPNDQHSLLQQFVEGARDKSFLFIRNKQSETSQKITNLVDKELKLFYKKSVGELLGLQAQATRLCLQRQNIPTAEILVQDHSPKTIGALIYFFELLVATLADRLEINAYNQPGVEDVKKVVLGTLGDLRYSDQALK